MASTDPFTQEPYDPYQLYQPGGAPNPAYNGASTGGQTWGDAPQDVGGLAPANTAPTTTPNTGVTGGGTVQAPQLAAAPQSSPFNYEKARDSWMSGQYGTGASGAAAWAAANGVPYTGGDTITLPNGGGMIDIIGNYAGGAGNGQPMANNWTPAGGNGPAPGGSAAREAILTGLSGKTGLATGDPMQAVGGQSATDPLQQTLRDTLLKQMQGFGQPIDENAPGIAQPFQAAKNVGQRQLEQERAQLAERLYAQGGTGLNGDALNKGIQQSNENLALGLGQFKGQLFGQEIAAQRGQVQQALQLANAIGARQEAQQLTKQLADLDNQYRYAQLGQQESQFGRSLGQQQGQFNDTYGLQRQQMIDAANRAAYLAALGG